jgi:hypothetical protein
MGCLPDDALENIIHFAILQRQPLVIRVIRARATGRRAPVIRLRAMPGADRVFRGWWLRRGERGGVVGGARARTGARTNLEQEHTLCVSVSLFECGLYSERDIQHPDTHTYTHTARA